MTKLARKALGHRFTYIHVGNLANIHRSLLYSHLFLAAALKGPLTGDKRSLFRQDNLRVTHDLV